jgi:hypothetical protein
MSRAAAPAPAAPAPAAPARLRDGLKRLGAGGLALAPQCRFARCVFLIGHMRCGSTALSNVLCARPDFSGFGEGHVAYDRASAPGSLALAQIRQRAWKPGAAHLFDKILHDRLDADPPGGFFAARAIFMTRAPGATLPSITRLFRGLGARRYTTDAEAEAYYVARLARMAALWDRFPEPNRLALDHAELVASPEAALARLSGFLGLAPPLCNAYASPPRPARHGAGDPLNAHRFSGIVAGGVSPAAEADAPPHAIRAYDAFRALTGARP